MLACVDCAGISGMTVFKRVTPTINVMENVARNVGECHFLYGTTGICQFISLKANKRDDNYFEL